MIREFLQDSPLLGRYLSHQPSGEWPSYEVQAPVALLTYGNIMLNVDFDILFHIVRINLLQSTIRGHREAQRCVCLYHFIFVVFLQPDVKPHFLWHLWIIQQTLEHLIQKDYIFLSDSTSDLLLMLFFIVYPVYPMFFLGSSNIYIIIIIFPHATRSVLGQVFANGGFDPLEPSSPLEEIRWFSPEIGGENGIHWSSPGKWWLIMINHWLNHWLTMINHHFIIGLSPQL